MIELDARARRFIKSIRDEGERSCAAIRAETASQIQAELEATRQAEQARADRTVKFEQERARTQANRELSQARTLAREKLAARRQQLADEVFDAARVKLAAFAAGGDYPAWLGAEAAALAQAMGAGAVLYARTADLPLLQKALPAGCTAAADDGIALGGLRAKSKNGALAADDTLESRLEGCRDWFLSHAGLTITV